MQKREAFLWTVTALNLGGFVLNVNQKKANEAYAKRITDFENERQQEQEDTADAEFEAQVDMQIRKAVENRRSTANLPDIRNELR